MSFAFEVERVRRSLQRTSREVDGQGAAFAAVAVVLVEGSSEVLLIQRAERPGDAWSGHIALPGGHREDGDLDLLATAVRETHEEVGLQLDRDTHFLGMVPAVEVLSRRMAEPRLVQPFVFVVPRTRSLVLSDEVADAFWVAVPELLGERREGVRVVPFGGTELVVPAFVHAKGVVWGMTYRVLTDLAARCGEEPD